MSESSSALLIDIMERCETGLNRLKGNLPEGTVVAHKTGTIGRTTNDVGIFTLPGEAGHVIVVAFVKESEVEVPDRERAIAERRAPRTTISCSLQKNRLDEYRRQVAEPPRFRKLIKRGARIRCRFMPRRTQVHRLPAYSAPAQENSGPFQCAAPQPRDRVSYPSFPGHYRHELRGSIYCIGSNSWSGYIPSDLAQRRSARCDPASGRFEHETPCTEPPYLSTNLLTAASIIARCS